LSSARREEVAHCLCTTSIDKHKNKNTQPTTRAHSSRFAMESSCRDPCKSHEPSDDILTFLQIVHQSINAPDANSFHPSLAETLGQCAEQASDGHPIDAIARLDVTEALIQLTARLINLRISGLYEDDCQVMMNDCTTCAAAPQIPKAAAFPV
jgi:hypothetical protein